MNQFGYTSTEQGAHEGQSVRLAGEPLDRARAAMVMVHGRGATAESILELAFELNQPGFAYLAPQAAQNTWYPNSFLAPIPSNEPWLSSALALLASVLKQVQAGGMPLGRTMLLVVLQGACLAPGFSARRAQRHGGIACVMVMLI